LVQSLILKDEVYQIIGVALKVHTELGCGFLEAVYQEAFEYELENADIPYEKEKIIRIKYNDIILNKKYIADFVCFDKIIIEMKALSNLCSEHESQILNYLKATGLKVGLLINFGGQSLEWKRFVK
jgi:GxxExxY protein